MPAQLSPELIAKALALQAQCWTQERIAKELGVHRRTVERNLAKVNAKVMDRVVRRASATKARQISQLEWIADESVQAWERSKQDAETIKTIEEGGTPNGANGEPGIAAFSKTETTVKGQAGDAGYLTQARAALADVRAILGLDAPTKTLNQNVDSDFGDDDSALQSLIAAASKRERAAATEGHPGEADTGGVRDAGEPGPVGDAPAPGPAE